MAALGGPEESSMRMVVMAALVAGCGGSLEFTQANNYSFSANIGLAEVDVAAVQDGTVDWSAVTTDLRGRPFDGTPDQVAMIACPESKEDLLGQLNGNVFTQDSCPNSWLYDPGAGETSAAFSQFSIIGNPLVPESDLLEDERNWIVSILDTAGGRDDALMSIFVNFVSSTEDTTIAVTDDSTMLEFTVSLDSPAIAASPKSTKIDWSTVADDVFGNTFDPLRGDELLVARFDVTDVSEVEDVFLRLDTDAADLYRLTVFGVTSADLSLATNADGAAFDGFTSDGIWLVSIGCTACLNPAPLLLAVVDAG